MVEYLIKDIADGVKLLRLDDDRTRYFEAAWHIPEGVTYNSYLIETSEGLILIDTWKGQYSELFMKAIKEVANASKIKYVIINHAEPDHTGSLPALLREANDAKVAVNVAGVKILKAKYDIKNEIISVEGTKEINLLGEDFIFIHVPWVHWPETMLLYQKRTKILYTCDVFGSFSIPTSYRADLHDSFYLKSAEKYLITVMGYYRKYVLNAIEKVKSMNLEILKIAPSHGGIWDKNAEEPMRLFEKWARGEPEKNKVTIAYVSMYGSVEEAVSKVYNELASKDISVKTFAINDSEYPDFEDFLTEANSSSVVLLATPTYDTSVHPRMKVLLELIKDKFRGVSKPFAAMVSYGWGSNAIKYMENSLKEAGLEVILIETFREKITDEQVKKITSVIKDKIKA
ncbi:MAG: FprA family A-type flavoprotein [Nitrososphaeria archaeon]